MKLVHETLERGARLFGEKPCMLSGDLRFTYRETLERVRRLSSAFLALGLQPGDHLGVLMNNCHQYFECYFAAAFAGLPIVPLNQRLTAPELEFILSDAAVKS